MAVSDFAQSLNVIWSQDAHRIRFIYANHEIEIPMFGHTASMDGVGLDLGQNVLTVQGSLFVPVDKITQALGLTTIQYRDKSILFRPESGKIDSIFTKQDRLRKINSK